MIVNDVQQKRNKESVSVSEDIKMKANKLEDLISSGRALSSEHDAIDKALKRLAQTASEKVYEVYNFYDEYKDDNGMHELVEAKLIKAKKKLYENDPLYKRLLRLIFSIDQRTRAHTYSRVIASAIAHDVAPSDFLTWINEIGGVKKAAALSDTGREEISYEEIAERLFEQQKIDALFEWPELSEEYQGRKAVVLVDVLADGKLKVLAADAGELVDTMTKKIGMDYSKLQIQNDASLSLAKIREQLKQDALDIDEMDQ